MKIPPLISAVALACVLPLAVAAQPVVGRCDNFEANARNLMMPPEIAVQSFAEGRVRTIGLDTLDPGCCSEYLMVDFFTERGPFPLCVLISGANGQGFAGLDMTQLIARPDPATPLTLTLTLPAGRVDGPVSVMSPLHVTIDQATGLVTARHD